MRRSTGSKTPTANQAQATAVIDSTPCVVAIASWVYAAVAKFELGPSLVNERYQSSRPFSQPIPFATATLEPLWTPPRTSKVKARLAIPEFVCTPQ